MEDFVGLALFVVGAVIVFALSWDSLLVSRDVLRVRPDGTTRPTRINRLTQAGLIVIFAGTLFVALGALQWSLDRDRLARERMERQLDRERDREEAMMLRQELETIRGEIRDLLLRLEQRTT